MCIVFACPRRYVVVLYFIFVFKVFGVVCVKHMSGHWL